MRTMVTISAVTALGDPLAVYAGVPTSSAPVTVFVAVGMNTAVSISTSSEHKYMIKFFLYL